MKQEEVSEEWCDWHHGNYFVVDGEYYDLQMRSGRSFERCKAYCENGRNNFFDTNIMAIRRSK